MAQVQQHYNERQQAPLKDRIFKIIFKKDPDDYYEDIIALDQSLPNVWLIIGIALLLWTLATAFLGFSLVVTYKAYRYCKERKENAQVVRVEETKNLIY